MPGIRCRGKVCCQSVDSNQGFEWTCGVSKRFAKNQVRIESRIEARIESMLKQCDVSESKGKKGEIQRRVIRAGSKRESSKLTDS